MQITVALSQEKAIARYADTERLSGLDAVEPRAVLGRLGRVEDHRASIPVALSLPQDEKVLPLSVTRSFVDLDVSMPHGLSADLVKRLPVATGGTEWACLAEALYFEARGENLTGQIAVAEVILNRVDSRKYPGTVCGVISQGASRRNACQFSFKCDGRPEEFHEHKAYERVGKVAKVMLDGRLRMLTDGATHYHSTSVTPGWSRKLTRTAQIGVHVFYRFPDRAAQN